MKFTAPSPHSKLYIWMKKGTQIIKRSENLTKSLRGAVRQWPYDLRAGDIADGNRGRIFPAIRLSLYSVNKNSWHILAMYSGFPPPLQLVTRGATVLWETLNGKFPNIGGQCQGDGLRSDVVCAGLGVSKSNTCPKYLSERLEACSRLVARARFLVPGSVFEE